ncbi:heparinase II/III family protein, partial [Candidatus Woesearchaeota archaeon]|nr:heparinase II/III family protein [Candidatus Woesearchaeota archaeon]
GSLYSMWSLRHLIYYFEARERYDGYSYFDEYPELRNQIMWHAYNVLPERADYTNNLNSADFTVALFHNTMLEWIMHKMPGSPEAKLSNWIWVHVFGEYGLIPWQFNTDLLSMILWHDSSLPLENPATYLKQSHAFPELGWYVFRTGWQDDVESDDVMFEFYPNGKFPGGHNQADKNQITLYEGDSRFLIDKGPAGDTHPENYMTQYHNLVLIDNKGQIDQTNNCGSDGNFTQHFYSQSADFLTGDNTFAYTRLSECNDDDLWCSRSNANPVHWAERNILVVKDFAGKPYFVLQDDIEKDGADHDYSLLLQSPGSATVLQLPAQNAFSIYEKGRSLDVYWLNPDYDTLQIDTSINNAMLRTTSTISNVQNPLFTYALVPKNPSAVVEILAPAGGYGIRLTNGVLQDIVLVNDGPGSMSYNGIEFTGKFAYLRYMDGELEEFGLYRGISLAVDGVQLVTINAPSNVYADGTDIYIDDVDLDYVIYGPSVHNVWFEDVPVDFVIIDDYVYPGGIILPDCDDEDQDGYSAQGGGDCCGPTGDQLCPGTPDCDDLLASCGVDCNPGIPTEVWQPSYCADTFNNDCDAYTDGDDIECSPFNIDQDQIIDVTDLGFVASDFHKVPGEVSGHERTDVNQDGRIDILDLVQVAINFNT